MDAELDRLVLVAALGQPPAAVAAWQQWRSAVPQAEAPGTLAWAGGYIHRNLSAAGTHDRWLAGIYRHNWLTNNRRAVQAAGILRRCNGLGGIVPLKSLAQSVDENSRGLRPVADVDVFVHFGRLPEMCRELDVAGYQPLLDVDGHEVCTRIARRRGSWNYIDPSGSDVDLHWRLFDHLEIDENQRLVFEHTEVRDAFFGPCPQLATELVAVHVASHHMLQVAPDSRLYGLFDFTSLAARSNADLLWRLADRAEVSGAVAEANELVGAATGRAPLPAPPRRPRLPRHGLDQRDPQPIANRRLAAGLRVGPRRNPEIAERCEPERLRYGRLYAWWRALGSPAAVERAVVSVLGPFTKRSAPVPSRIDFGHRQPTASLIGPGWCLQLPEDHFRWTDGPDARVLLDIGEARTGRLLELVLDRYPWTQSRARYVDVHANGVRVGTTDPWATRFSFKLPAHLHGIIDVSLRARYPQRLTELGPGMHFFRLSLPIVSIEVHPGEIRRRQLRSG